MQMPSPIHSSTRAGYHASPSHLLSKVELYLKRSGTPPTRFGKEAMHDPRFVFDLRNGREPSPRTVARVTAFLERAETSA